MDSLLERYQALEDHMASYLPHLNRELLRAAFDYANSKHEGQLRKDGSPYITHPLAVAEIVADLGLDAESVMAALLHDTVEDTDATHDEVAHKFGETVALLVDGVTKLTRMQFTSKEDAEMENLRKMFMAMAKDVRVILIKLCDRLHNMRTMMYQSPRKQKEKSLETMEIYAPIAHRLGMQRIKWELEDTSLQYLDPIGYKEISDELAKRTAVNGEFLESIQSRIENRMQDDGIHATVYGRVKHTYSIYRKMYTQGKTLDQIFDLYAFRVVVDDIASCYNVLGCIHDMFNPILGRFKDYIGTPKPNGYQSLHTTVLGHEGIPFEVQIRTWDMHQTAEYGIAAHWKYKQGMANEKLGTEGTFEWVRKLLENQENTDAEEFMSSLKVDMFADEVFVFTPNGDVKSLPSGSTPIDFAYAIHSAVGNRMTGAKVNGRLVPFDTVLQSGDIVEVITSKASKGPSRDWMKICKSNEARSKIRQWFKKEKREENIVNGRAAFESALKANALSMATITDEAVLPSLLRKVKFNALDDLYAAIGYGGASAQKSVDRIKDELRRLDRIQAEKAAAEKTAQEAHVDQSMIPSSVAQAEPKKPLKHSKSGVIVEGLDGCMVKFAKCCTPVPGDDIIGFITKGYGVSVHRKDCPNASPKLRKKEDESRWVQVSWDTTTSSAFTTTLDIFAKDRDNLTLDIAMILSASKVRVTTLAAHSTADATAEVTIIMEVHDQLQLSTIINKLSQVNGVYQVSRANGR